MTCPLCNGTGYLKRGMVVTPWYADAYVDWALTLVSCSHPTTASPESPAETDTHTGPLRSERDVRPEDRDGLVGIESVPVALAEQRAAHDERVARDVAAYQRLTGEQT